MSIMFRCQYCNAKIKVPEEKAGMNGKCPKCGKLVPVPLASDKEFRNYDSRDKNILTKKDDSDDDISNKDTKNMMTFDQTELLHLPESIGDEVGNAKKVSTRKMHLDDYNTDEDDLLFLDDDSSDVPLESGVPGFIEDSDIKLTDDYFKILDEDESDELDDTEIVAVRKPAQVQAPKRIVKPAPKPVPRQAPRQVKRQKQTPPQAQRKRRPEQPVRKKVAENEKVEEESVKKSKGGCLSAFIGFIIIISIIACVFGFSSWLMLKRVENGKSPIDPAYKIMKFDERLKEIDNKMNKSENENSNSLDEINIDN